MKISATDFTLNFLFFIGSLLTSAIHQFLWPDNDGLFNSARPPFLIPLTFTTPRDDPVFRVVVFTRTSTFSPSPAHPQICEYCNQPACLPLFCVFITYHISAVFCCVFSVTILHVGFPSTLYMHCSLVDCLLSPFLCICANDVSS